MTDKKRKLLAAAVILTVLLVKLFSERINQFLWNDKSAPHFYWSILGQILYYLLPALAIIILFHRPGRALTELGIARGFLQGLGFGFLFTLPMLIGYWWMGHYQPEHSFIKNLVFAFKDGFREEIFYRAFLFGQLCRHAKWGFLPAVAMNGLIFGLSHLYQAHDLGDSLGVFAITFAGAVWFAWLYVEWNDNLWLPIFLHCFMNLYWDLFSTESSALGGFMLNLPRILTIAISVYLTIRIMRKRNGHLRIQRHNLFRQNQ